MASVERTYVDPSALRSLYVHDDRSARFCAWRGRLGGCLPLTRLGRAELVNSIHLAVHRRQIDERAARGAIADLETDVRDGRLALVDVLWRRTLELAAAVRARHADRLGAHRGELRGNAGRREVEPDLVEDVAAWGFDAARPHTAQSPVASEARA